MGGTNSSVQTIEEVHQALSGAHTRSILPSIDIDAVVGIDDSESSVASFKDLQD